MPRRIPAEQLFPLPTFVESSDYFVELKSIFQFIEVEIFTDVDGVLVLPVERPNGHALLLPGG